MKVEHSVFSSLQCDTSVHFFLQIWVTIFFFLNIIIIIIKVMHIFEIGYLEVCKGPVCGTYYSFMILAILDVFNSRSCLPTVIVGLLWFIIQSLFR